MTKNINVINNIGKDVNITVNGDANSIQLIIDFAEKGKQLSTLTPGTVFKGKSGREYILLEFDKDGNAAVLRKDLLPNAMRFGDDSNFNGSAIDEFLNDDYLKELAEDFGLENVLEHEVDLLSMDGLDDYGKVWRKASLLPYDMYRRCRKAIGKNMDKWWWLVNSWSTPSNDWNTPVSVVSPHGYVSDRDCDGNDGVRPFVSLNPSIFVSL